jgi:hypothetical protein
MQKTKPTNIMIFCLLRCASLVSRSAQKKRTNEWTSTLTNEPICWFHPNERSSTAPGGCEMHHILSHARPPCCVTKCHNTIRLGQNVKSSATVRPDTGCVMTLSQSSTYSFKLYTFCSPIYSKCPYSFGYARSVHLVPNQETGFEKHALGQNGGVPQENSPDCDQYTWSANFVKLTGPYGPLGGSLWLVRKRRLRWLDR